MTSEVDDAKGRAWWERCLKNLVKHRRSWVEYALTVQTIKAEKLYRFGYKTWEDFCRDELKITARWADQLISSAAIAEELKNQNNCSEINEHQARSLKDVPSEHRADVLEESNRTGESIEEVAPRVVQYKEPEVRRDKTNYPIPDHRLELFDREHEAKALLTHISDVRSTLRRAKETRDKLFSPIDIDGALTDLDRIFTELKLAVPYAVCPWCQGQTSDQCKACKKRGVISEFAWKTQVPEELRTIRIKAAEKLK